MVCGKWTLLVIRDLAEDSQPLLRARALARGHQPAHTVAAAAALEEEGIVERRTYPEVPPRVEYALTEKGRPSCR